MKQFLLIGLLWLALPLAVLAQKKEQTLSVKQFLEQPFGFDENIYNFLNNIKPRFRISKELSDNKHYPNVADTIYQLQYRKSEVFFIKTHSNKEFLLAGKIENRRIKLINDIHIGMKKEDFEACFSEKLSFQNNSITLQGEGTQYTFQFNQRNKLYLIKIDNYFD